MAKKKELEETLSELVNTDIPPGKPATSITQVEKSQTPELNFPNEDMINEAIRLISEALTASRSSGFSKKSFTFQDLNFILNILNYSKQQVVRSKKAIEVYSERDSKAKQRLLETMELLNFKVNL